MNLGDLTDFIILSSFISLSDPFDNKSKGFSTLLNDECTLQRPSIENYVNNLNKAWQNDKRAPIK